MSLLKAYWGDAATADNDFCFDYLPQITGDHGTYRTVLDMIDGKVKGYFLLGQNPAVGSAHGRAQRLGMANLDWLVVRDLFEIESATFWKDAPEVATGEIVPEECRTEVFFLPGRVARREGGHVHPDPADAAVAREGGRARRATAARELWFFYHLGRMLRERLADSSDDRDRPAARPGLGLPVHDEGVLGTEVRRPGASPAPRRC